MKLKNLAFFGVMASILSVASAQAADPVNPGYIASKGYVDSKFESVSSGVNTALENYPTTAEMNTELAKKQDTIADLATIRSGAEAGATAVQPDAITDMETKTHASATYATQDALTNGLATKQNTIDTNNKLDVALVDGALTSADISGKADTSYVNTELAKKQDTIADLATIRSGAEAGATALQPTSALDGSKLTDGSVAKTALATAVQNAIDGALQANTAIAASTANSIVQYDTNGLVLSGTPAGELATASMTACPEGKSCVVTKNADNTYSYTVIQE